MEPTLEGIKGGGGSIKVGTTGTISALMSKEIIGSTKSTTSAAKPRKSLDEPSSSKHNTSSSKITENTKRSKNHSRSSHQRPMLAADDLVVDGTPIRKIPSNVVDIVDIKCGSSDRKWVNPITDRLKKLNFSKLSESIV